MSTKFGWCLSGHHTHCRYEVSALRADMQCSCECHATDSVATGPTASGIGRIGATKNGPGSAELVAPAGASPTLLRESTDE